VISKGSLVAQGSIDDLRKLSRSRAVRVTVAPGGDAKAALASNESISRVEDVGDGAFVITWRDGVEDVDKATESVATSLVQAGLGLRELVSVKASLEQVFAELTEGEAA
jgi:ABC-type multidrug transport system ATPase subunit